MVRERTLASRKASGPIPGVEQRLSKPRERVADESLSPRDEVVGPLRLLTAEALIKGTTLAGWESRPRRKTRLSRRTEKCGSDQAIVAYILQRGAERVGNSVDVVGGVSGREEEEMDPRDDHSSCQQVDVELALGVAVVAGDVA